LLTLIIDTSTERSLVAFAERDRIVLQTLLPYGVQNSKHLMTTIESGLSRLRLSPFSLDAIAVSVGPGSYTGIRVGVAAAKGLAFPKSLPLIGFCSLEGYVQEREGRFASLIDARVGGMYVLLQEREGEKIHLRSTPQLITKERLDLYLEGYSIHTGPHLGYPNAHYLAQLVAKKWEAREYGGDVELIYLRTPEYTLAIP
jgi:tRNA threonylcarbamoyladenosine biosynthesis protein TsaB